MTGSPVAALRSAWSASISSLGRIAGAGVDLVELSAFTSLHSTGGSAFLDNAWSPAEQRDAEGSVERLATRWAAKEAVMKALRCGIGDMDPLDVEILSEPDGAPRVVLHRNARDAATALGVCRWHVSLCHEDGWAAAIAIADQHEQTAGPTHTHEGNGDA